VFITNAMNITNMICSLGHGLCTFTAVPRSTQPCIPLGVAKSSTRFGWGKGGNVISAGLCDPVWHLSTQCELLYQYTYCTIHMLFVVCVGRLYKVLLGQC